MMMRVVTYGAESLDAAEDWRRERAVGFEEIVGPERVDFIRTNSPARAGSIMYFDSSDEHARYGMKRQTLLDRQMDVMNFLWEHGSATPREIHSALDGELAFPAVRTIVHSLEEEGCVRAELIEDACPYRPAVTRRELGRRELRRVLQDFFGGSVSDFLQTVADLEGMPEERVRQLRNHSEKFETDWWRSARPG